MPARLYAHACDTHAAAAKRSGLMAFLCGPGHDHGCGDRGWREAASGEIAAQALLEPACPPAVAGRERMRLQPLRRCCFAQPVLADPGIGHHAGHGSVRGVLRHAHAEELRHEASHAARPQAQAVADPGLRERGIIDVAEAFEITEGSFDAGLVVALAPQSIDELASRPRTDGQQRESGILRLPERIQANEPIEQITGNRAAGMKLLDGCDVVRDRAAALSIDAEVDAVGMPAYRLEGGDAKRLVRLVHSGSR